MTNEKNKKLKNCIENELRQELTQKILKEHKEAFQSCQEELIRVLSASSEALSKTVALQEKQLKIYEKQLECSAKLFEEICPDRNFYEETIDEQGQKFINEANKFIDQQNEEMKQFDNVMGVLLKKSGSKKGRPRKIN